MPRRDWRRRPAGRTALTIHSTPSIATQWLMRRLPAYGDLHPEIDLRLQSSVNRIDLGQGIVDIDIRYNPGPSPGRARSWCRFPRT